MLTAPVASAGSRIEWVWLHWSEYLLARDEFYRWFQKMTVALAPPVELQSSLKEKQWQLSHAQVLLHTADHQAVLLDRLLEEAASLFNRIGDPSVDEDEQTQGDSEGQGSLACCNSWGCKESVIESTRHLRDCGAPHPVCCFMDCCIKKLCCIGWHFMEAALTEDKDSLWFCPPVSDLFAPACLSELFHPELQGHAINLYYLFIPQPPPPTHSSKKGPRSVIQKVA